MSLPALRLASGDTLPFNARNLTVSAFAVILATGRVGWTGFDTLRKQVRANQVLFDGRSI